MAKFNMKRAFVIGMTTVALAAGFTGVQAFRNYNEFKHLEAYDNTFNARMNLRLTIRQLTPVPAFPDPIYARQLVDLAQMESPSGSELQAGLENTAAQMQQELGNQETFGPDTEEEFQPYEEMLVALEQKVDGLEISKVQAETLKTHIHLATLFLKDRTMYNNPTLAEQGCSWALDELKDAKNYGMKGLDGYITEVNGLMEGINATAIDPTSASSLNAYDKHVAVAKSIDERLWDKMDGHQVQPDLVNGIDNASRNACNYSTAAIILGGIFAFSGLIYTVLKQTAPPKGAAAKPEEKK